ncbi:olfactomedin-like protein 1 [Pristis pectinata]|uniref:olfactomedin-like protein 1 n=1 Tax=Pristis pectinata TaxID=685728 RepID=UPI00223CE477|nr:olfactomedin-like protein 1 [Pristis pectinata]
MFSYVSGRRVLSMVSPRLLTFLLLTQVFGQAQRMTQDALLMQYIERRIMILEDRLEKCNQDMNKYVREFREFRKEIMFRLDGLNIYKSEFKNEVEVLGSRIERIEKDIDYLEAQQPTQPCLEIDEKLAEEEVQQEQKKKAKFRMSSDCDSLLTGIKSLKIVKKAGDVQGSWIKDPARDFQKIYFFSGTSGSSLMEFTGIKAFTESSRRQAPKRLTLPVAWQGTGHVAYNGFLYFHSNGTLNQIIKYNIRNETVSDRMLLQGAGRVPAYQLSPYTFIDLAVDEQGLWAIHAEPEDNGDGTIVVTKIDQGSLAVEHSWDTSCSSKGAEAAFMLCGTLYVVYNTHHGGRSHIQCLYDVTDVVTSAELPVLYFPKRYGRHSMIHYNPREQQLYAWDDGYQTIYKLITKKKLESSPAFK